MLTFDKKLELLRISSFLGTAPPGMLSEIAAAAHEESFDKGRFIYAKNDPAGDFYFLVQGRIGHPEVQAGDKGSLVYRADAPAQLFGFAAAVQGQPLRVISARCELPTTVLAVDGQWFQKLCTRYGKEGEERLRELVRAHAGYERTILGKPGWLSVRNAGKKYGSDGAVALDDCSIEVRPGEFSAVLGPRGSGKSTLARAIAGLELLDDGVMYLDGDVINRPGDKPKPRRICLHQRNSLRPAKTLARNLQRAMDGESAASHVLELLKQFGLSEFADRPTRVLPASIRCRAEIIAAFLSDADVIMFDEPFALELERTELHRLLLELHRHARKTVLFMTEDVEESVHLADRVQIMVDGRIRQSVLIDLPLLRRPELLATPELLHLRQKVFEALHARTEIAEVPGPLRRRADDKVAVELSFPAPDRALPPPNAIRKALCSGNFFWTIEFIPSVDKILRDELHKLGGITEVLAEDPLLAGFAVTDRVVSERDPDPVAAASHLLQYSGKQPIVHFSGKGRESDELDGFVERMQEDGLENALFLTGDRLKRELPGQRPRYLESVPAIERAKQLNPRLWAAAALNPFKYREEDAMAQYLKLGKKVGAGADFVITQIGFDMRKYEEALDWMDMRNYRVPLVANVMPMPPARARYIRHHQLAGVTVTDSVMALLEEEERVFADKGASRVMRRLALQIVGLKLFGYSGIQVTGLHSIEKMSALKTQVAELSELCRERDTWSKAWKESFTLPEGGHADPAPLHAWYLDRCRSGRSNRRNAREYRHRAMSGIHDFLFADGLGAKLVRPVLKPVRRHSEVDRLLTLMERAMKGPLFGCETCGMCRLAATQYICPETCPKGLANGPCGGTTENLCEFRDRECIHSAKYRVARDAGVLHELESWLIPAVPKDIRNTCSWPPYLRGEGPRIRIIEFLRPPGTQGR